MSSAIQLRTIRGRTAMTYNDVAIRCDDGEECYNLTDMWWAVGSPENRDPREWSRKSGREFILDTVRRLNIPLERVWRTKRGNGGGTEAHWQIAVAYAKYLDHDFHRHVNAYYRAGCRGHGESPREVVPTSPPQWEVVQGSQTEQLLQMARGLVGVLEVQRDHEVKLSSIEVQVDEQSRELARLKHEREVAEARYQEAESNSKAKLKAIEDRTKEAVERAERAQGDANRAVRTVTSEANWFCLVTWAETRGVHLGPGADSREGKIVTGMCRAAGITPRKIRTPRFPGGVNAYPEHVLNPWLVDYLNRNPLVGNSP